MLNKRTHKKQNINSTQNFQTKNKKWSQWLSLKMLFALGCCSPGYQFDWFHSTHLINAWSSAMLIVGVQKIYAQYVKALILRLYFLGIEDRLR